MELASMKYCELQQLAKDVGLKANLKADKLLKVLKEHFQQQEDGLEKAAIVNEAEAVKAAGHNPTKTLKRKLSDDSSIGVSKNKPDQEVKQADKVQSAENASVTTEGKLHAEVSPGRKAICHAVSQAKTGPAALKLSTPNFKKIHAAHFKKMESIDTYVEKKRRRVEDFSNSVKEIKMLAEKASLLKSTEKKTPLHNEKVTRERDSLFSPSLSAVPKDSCTPSHNQRSRSSTIGTPGNLRRSPRISTCLTNKSILCDKSAFKPSNLSSAKLNVRFTEATKDNEHKRSLTKTPARMSPYFSSFDTPTICEREPEQRLSQKTESVGAKIRTSVATPFKFSAQRADTPGTNKKTNFDLKASLARPLGYQPHKGKLKPWADTKENNPPNMPVNTAASLKKNYKQPVLQTREDRREKLKEERNEKKQNIMKVRRGLVMS